MAKHGPVWIERQEGKLPKVCYSPFWVVQNKEYKKLLALLTEFGMTPSSRSRVCVETVSDEELSYQRWEAERDRRSSRLA